MSTDSPAAPAAARTATRPLHLLFGAGMLVLGTALVISLFSLQRYRVAAEYRARSQTAVMQLNTVLTALLNVETGSRGFALTGREQFVEPYNLGIGQYRETRVRLPDIVVSHADQKALLQQLLQEGDLRVEVAAKLIGARRMENATVDALNGVAEEGKQVMDRVRRIVSAMTQLEEDQLKHYEAQTEAAERQALGTILAALALAMVMFGTAYAFYWQEYRKRTRAEHTLKSRNAELAAEKMRAESADRLKSAFLATMSHELRTPLNSIIGFSGVLLQRLPGPLNAEQEKQLGWVMQSARHLHRLVNEILDLSKIEAGQLELEREQYSLANAVDHVLEITRPHATQKGLSLSSEVTAKGTLVGDRRRLEQILINLVANAIKFTERGSVTVRAADVGPEEIEVSVIDTGTGIAEADLARIFRPFEQLGTGLSRKHDGTGLGLSISRSLAGLMGGTITVRSEWGHGSTFLLRLPRNAPTPSNQSAPLGDTMLP